MKCIKFFSRLLALAVAIVLVLAPLTAQAYDPISVTINGVQVQFTDQHPVIVEDRTLVPVGGVFAALGFTPSWDSEARTATLISPEFTIVITIGSAVFTTNGVQHALDVPADIINERTMLPLRALLESIGILPENIGWNSYARAITVVTATPDGETSPPATGAAAFVGTWDWVIGSATTEAYYVLNANGTGTMLMIDEHIPIHWWTNAGMLFVCVTPGLCGPSANCIAPMAWYYSLNGNNLELVSAAVTELSFSYVRQ